MLLRPELVVEIALDGAQRSTRYPGGVALRFARVLRYRPDKTPAEADTIDAVRRPPRPAADPGAERPAVRRSPGDLHQRGAWMADVPGGATDVILRTSAASCGDDTDETNAREACTAALPHREAP